MARKLTSFRETVLPVPTPTIMSRYRLLETACSTALLAIALSAFPVTLSAQAGATTPPAQARRAPASPRDSLKVTIAGAEISVNYGRPSKRGREIFGGLNDMQWGMVWRMGANEATAFTTTKDLVFGQAVVPAGSYTLWVKLEQTGKWVLIVNSQTGQWGTAYSERTDLVHIPMTVTALPSVVEMMEIAVKPSGRGGELSVEWDRTRAAVTFTVK